MNDFEKEYYEDEVHWNEESLQDSANLERIEFTAGMVPKEVKSLLDAGCGNGAFVNFLQKSRADLHIMAVDRSVAALKYVQTTKKEANIDNIPADDRSYDCVTCLEVLEHLPIQVYEKAIFELTRIAKQYIIISVPYQEIIEGNYTKCPSCKTIFNYDLHMRNFDDHRIKHLLDKYNFSCLSSQHLGMSVHYKGHYKFRKIFYREQFTRWRAPICPLCGFREQQQKPAQEAHTQIQHVSSVSGKKKLISYISWLPKLIWPKEKKYYWIIGLYKRND